MKATKKEKVKTSGSDKEIWEVEKLFRDMEKDRRLPTFGEFFVRCIMLGIAENVNLKKLYPATFKKLTVWMEGHNRRVSAMNKTTV